MCYKDMINQHLVAVWLIKFCYQENKEDRILDRQCDMLYTLYGYGQPLISILDKMCDDIDS